VAPSVEDRMMFSKPAAWVGAERATAVRKAKAPVAKADNTRRMKKRV
jgi:hypothetical protein